MSVDERIAAWKAEARRLESAGYVLSGLTFRTFDRVLGGLGLCDPFAWLSVGPREHEDVYVRPWLLRASFAANEASLPGLHDYARLHGEAAVLRVVAVYEHGGRGAGDAALRAVWESP